MPVTAIKILKEGKEERMLFMTAMRGEKGVDVDIYLANEEFMPMGTPSLGFSNDSEENYHRELRKQSQERGHFVPEFSTNREWNPDYVPGENEEIEKILLEEKPDTNEESQV